MLPSHMNGELEYIQKNKFIIGCLVNLIMGRTKNAYELTLIYYIIKIFTHYYYIKFLFYIFLLFIVNSCYNNLSFYNNC